MKSRYGCSVDLACGTTVKLVEIYKGTRDIPIARVVVNGGNPFAATGHDGDYSSNLSILIEEMSLGGLLTFIYRLSEEFTKFRQGMQASK
jgi:hypothetical protein